jgi:hypothetical protein
MKRFAAAWSEAVEAPTPAAAEAALTAYLRDAPPLDAAWALWFLAGRRVAGIPAREIRALALEVSGAPAWLFDESHRVVGNLPETVAHLLASGRADSECQLHQLVADRLAPLAVAGREERRRLLLAAWGELGDGELELWNRLVVGVLRPRPALATVARAAAAAMGGNAETIAERLAGEWSPAPGALELLAATARGATVNAPLFADEERAGAGGADESLMTTVGDGAELRARAAERHFEVVLLYAQRSGGGRGDLYSELTLGAWEGKELVPVTRLDARLPAGDALELDRWVRRNIVARFGPVRHVRPELVFELACTGVLPSARHKAGLTLREARLVAWRRERTAGEAATLESLRELLPNR